MRTIAIIVLIGLILITSLLSSVNAQDYYELYKPTMNPPSITITSPQNNSIINTNSLQLTFNITEPQIVKLSPNISPNIIENKGVRNSTDIFSVQYKGDWQTEEQTLYSDESGGLGFLEINETVSNIPNGEHEIQITAVGSVDLIVAMFGFTYHPDSSSTIQLIVNNPVPQTTLTTAPSMSIISPLPVTYHNSSVPLYFGANVLTDDSEVVFLRYSLDGNVNVTLTELRKTGTQNFASNKTGVTYHVEEMLSNLGAENHTLRVYSHDANGNEMSSSVEFTIDIHNETSTQKDNFFYQNLLLLIAIAFIVVVAGLGFLVHFKKKQT